MLRACSVRLGPSLPKHLNKHNKRRMKIAIEGCCHGELDAIYAHIASLEQKNNYKVSLLLIGGDFQAIRNERDLQCMAVPDKYRKLGGFWKYYTGKKTAPILTIVIGGNHEASNYLWELYHGGWLAPNIYFLGHAGCVQVNGVRIAGASGIWKRHDFHLGHHEQLPYSSSAMRSIYHIREYNIRRLSLLSSPKIFLSHDWPQSIEHHGDTSGLLKRKPFFRADIEKGELGSPPMMGLLRTLKPKWWFSAHLHVKFEASVVHDVGPQSPDLGEEQMEEKVANPDEIIIEDVDVDGGVKNDKDVGEKKGERLVGPTSMNPDEITLDDEEDGVEAPPPPPPKPATRQETTFLALDKCLPKRHFLEVVDVIEPPDFVSPQTASKATPVLSFDPEWLAITRAFNPYMSTTPQQATYPDEEAARKAVRENLGWIRENVLEGKSIIRVEDCQQFCETAPPPGSPDAKGRSQPPYYRNPQTAAFCSMLGIDNKVDAGR